MPSAPSCSRTCVETRSTVMPALTSPTTRPPSRIGVTTRIDGPRVPVYVSTKVSPSSARSMWPMKGLPISAAFGWVQRTPSGSMIVTKAIPVPARTRSAYGWSTADGSGVRIASRTDGDSAMARAAARTCRFAVSSACARPDTYAKTAQPATTAATSRACITNSWPARLRGRTRGRRMPPVCLAGNHAPKVARKRL